MSWTCLARVSGMFGILRGNREHLKQRYHYNVADSRLHQHVHNEDGLLISCVASTANLWALIMDAGTGFTSQVYEFVNGLPAQGLDYGTMGKELLYKFDSWFR